MSKEEVLQFIYSEPSRKVYANAGFFSEQKTQWEIWMLCVDLDSCIINATGRERCYQWHMIAFEARTNRVVKVFSDYPESAGFE